MSAPLFPSQSSTGTGTGPGDHSLHDADLAETARHDIAEVASQVKEEAAAIGEEARTQIKQATEKAKGLANEQKQLLVDQLDGVSTSLFKVADDLEANGEGSAHYARMLADGAGKLTATVRDNNVDDILAIAQDFGRKQPVAFMGAAALLGFVASRFVVASASRRSDRPEGEWQDPDKSANNEAGTPSLSHAVGGTDAGI